MRELQRLGYEDAVLDFMEVTRAWPDPMVPLICGVEAFRREGIDQTVGASDRSNAAAALLEC